MDRDVVIVGVGEGGGGGRGHRGLNGDWEKYKRKPLQSNTVCVK